MIDIDVHMVQTRSRSHEATWVAQDKVRRQTRAHITEARNSLDEADAIWATLQNCNITLSLSRMLDLIPRFWDRLTWAHTLTVALVTPTTHVRDEHCPTILLTIKDQEIPSVVIDGGSGMNVISEVTCTSLGLQEWELCPFHLRMANTSAVRPLGLIMKLPILIGGELFEISTVVLRLSEQGRYPLLLGQAWLQAAAIKQDWTKDRLSFRQGGMKICVTTTTS